MSSVRRRWSRPCPSFSPAGFAVLWLPLVMNPVGRNSDEPRYGLLNPDGSARVTGTAFTAMAQAAAGATATAVSGKGLTGVALEKDGKTQVFVWSPAGDVMIKLGPGQVAKPIAAQGGSGAPGRPSSVPHRSRSSSNRTVSELLSTL